MLLFFERMVATMNIISITNTKELREKMGMNRREFSDYYGIPYRTVQDWEAEKRELPDYLLRLLKYRAEIERQIKSGDN